ncbi:MAG TPA: hypothetical protein VM582_10200 [Candidatus Thermoplasmatota archaeon]|nr:hypothetical protein [Candidatus Thermoplasmatota archaeon]
MVARVKPILLVGLLFFVSGAGAFHEPEPPLRYERTHDATGWTAVRFDALGERVRAQVSLQAEGPAGLHLLLYDETDAAVVEVHLVGETLGGSARVATGVLPVQVLTPFLFEVGASLQGAGSTRCPSTGWGATISSGGFYSVSVDVPVSCGGHRVQGALLAGTGRQVADVRLQLRSVEELEVREAAAEATGFFVDASGFDGASVELTGHTTRRSPFTVGYALDATRALDIEHALVGAYMDFAWEPSHPRAQLTYAHGDDAGACPCAWQGGEATRGPWTFGIGDGLRYSRVYLSGVDAALP